MMAGLHSSMLTVLIFLSTYVLQHHESAGDVEVSSISSNITVDIFYDTEALFGHKLSHNETISGSIVAGNPLNGCVEALPHPVYPSTKILPSIALVMRGNCSFHDKARAAENGKFIALIVFNDEDDSTFPMSSDSSYPINIPAIMIGLSAGMKIRDFYCFQDDSTYLVTIHPNPRAIISPFLISVIAIVVLVTLCTVVFCACRVYLHHRLRRRRCLTLAQLNTLSVIVFEKNEGSDGTCAICLEEFADKDKLRLLPCHHVYHCKCIDHWLLSGRRVCPICKRPAYGRSRRRRENLSTSDSDYDDENGVAVATGIQPRGWTSAYGAVSGVNLSTNPGPSVSSEATETTPLLAVDARDTEAPLSNSRKSTWQWPWKKFSRSWLTSSRFSSTALQRTTQTQSFAENAGVVSGSHSSPTLPNAEVSSTSRQLNMVQVIVHRTETPDDNASSSC